MKQLISSIYDNIVFIEFNSSKPWTTNRYVYCFTFQLSDQSRIRLFNKRLH